MLRQSPQDLHAAPKEAAQGVKRKEPGQVELQGVCGRKGGRGLRPQGHQCRKRQSSRLQAQNKEVTQLGQCEEQRGHQDQKRGVQ